MPCFLTVYIFADGAGWLCLLFTIQFLTSLRCSIIYSIDITILKAGNKFESELPVVSILF